MRVCVVGFGTVGRWLVAALHAQRTRLRSDYGVGIDLVGVANARDGFVFRDRGLDPSVLADLAAAGRPISEHPGTLRWPTAAEGLHEVDTDLLVETSASPAHDGEPGLTHMREALSRGAGVVTSNKWPVALAGLELTELARRRRIPFRAESTVMSGTPVLGPLVEGLAGATPEGLRGVLNATANSILTTIRRGTPYEEALRAAQAAGLAEPDPSADVDGHDAVAKLMILSALVFGRQLRPVDVSRRGISAMDEAELRAAADPGRRIREVATLGFAEPGGRGAVSATVEPALLEPGDPLADVDGTTNAVVCRAAPLGEIRIVGPGAGPTLAGQGCLSDLISVAKWE
jgi:homoserine dehydrogenase